MCRECGAKLSPGKWLFDFRGELKLCDDCFVVYAETAKEAYEDCRATREKHFEEFDYYQRLINKFQLKGQ